MGSSTVQVTAHSCEVSTTNFSAGPAARSRPRGRPCRSGAGRAILVSGSSRISSHWASQPAVRGMANMTVNMSVGIFMAS